MLLGQRTPIMTSNLIDKRERHLLLNQLIGMTNGDLFNATPPIIRALDRNNDGTISPEELKTALEQFHNFRCEEITIPQYPW